MISIDEAMELISSAAQPLPVASCATEAALGMTLAEDIASDIDSPPFDKSMMDGFAVRAEDTSDSGYRLRVLEQVTAGETPSQAIGSGEATQIMTGAPVPQGCDAVVMVERTRIEETADGQWVEVEGPALTAGQNILPQATALARDQVVLARGHHIRAMEIGLLLEVGRTSIQCIPRPLVAVIPTGNEIIPAGDYPRPGQIRNSNGPMIEAQVRQAGGDVLSLGIGRDDPDELVALMRRGLHEADVLVLSGGVSAGVLDLVPAALERIGVRQIFHKVMLKPGKPLWFGDYEHEGRRKLVFGLPGNPNSSLVCFELFVRPALSALSGRGMKGLRRGTAQMAEPHQHRGNRPTFFPAKTEIVDGQLVVRALAWKGSADQRTLCLADSLLCLAPGERDYAVGDPVTVLQLQ